MPTIPDLPEAARRLIEKLPPEVGNDLRRKMELPSPPAPGRSADPPPPPKGTRRRRQKAAKRPSNPAPKRPPPSRQNRAERRQRRRDEADREHLERLRKRYPHHPPPPLVPSQVWTMVQDCLADLTGRAIRYHARRLNNPIAAGAIRRAALVPIDDGTTRYSWRDDRARRIAALGLALVALAIPTRRKGQYTTLARGYSRACLAALLADPWSRQRPSIAALAGTHRPGATLDSGQLGYLRALERAGLCYAQQLPAHLCEPSEVGPSGYACNRYWIVAAMPYHSGELHIALLELHADGWHLIDYAPVRAPRSRRGPLRALEPPLAQPP